MSKPIVEYVNEWPMMSPLGKKELSLVQSNVGESEEILGIVIGNFGQAIVATETRVLVVKTGLMAGQSFGGKATSFDYGNIVGIEVRTGFTQGEFELLSGGLVSHQGNRNKDRIKVSESPNGLVFPKVDAPIFQAMATKIREMTAKSHAGTQGTATVESIPDTIKKLAELHKDGILSDEEFSTKKEELLKRM